MGLSSFDLKDYMTNTAIKIMYERNFINMHLEQMDILGVHNNVYIKGSFDRLVYFYDELKKALGSNVQIHMTLNTVEMMGYVRGLVILYYFMNGQPEIHLL